MNEELKPGITDDAKKTNFGPAAENATTADGENDNSAAPGRRVTFGFVDAVHGPGSEVLPTYGPTRHELLELTRYWMAQVLEIEMFWFLTATSGSHDCTMLPYAKKRLDRIAKVLGEKAVKEVVTQVQNEYRREMGDKNWEILLHGTEEERDKILQQAYAEQNLDPEDNEWQVLGRVTIDTGTLLLIDPVHNGADVGKLCESDHAQVSIPGGDFSAVLVGAGMGDGRYSAEGRSVECPFGRRIAEIRVRFLNDDGDYLGGNKEES